jgi:hypothetical protein
VKRTKMVWLPLQNFPVATLRVCQLSLPMQRHSLVELGLQCRRSRLLCLRLGISCFRHCYFLNCSRSDQSGVFGK